VDSKAECECFIDYILCWLWHWWRDCE